MPDIGSPNLTEIQFLQSKSDAGNLIMVNGSISSATGVITSYTPASSTTFVVVMAKINWTVGTGSSTTQLRNNTTVRETSTGVMGSGQQPYNYEYIIRGDTLVGDGAKTYDLNCSANTGQTIYGVILGYLE